MPSDIMLSLGEIRDWAVRSGFVWDRDSQLLGEDRLAGVSRVVTSEDQLGVAMSILNQNGELQYFEFPFLSVRSLIKRGTDISIVYWRAIPTQWDPNGQVTLFGEVRFGFWMSGCGDEFCSLSTAVQVVTKFVAEMEKLTSEFPVKCDSQGAREIVVNGAVLATFLKQGRLFDVVLSHNAV